MLANHIVIKKQYYKQPDSVNVGSELISMSGRERGFVDVARVERAILRFTATSCCGVLDVMRGQCEVSYSLRSDLTFFHGASCCDGRERPMLGLVDTSGQIDWLSITN